MLPSTLYIMWPIQPQISFEVNTSNGLEGDAFTRNVSDARTDRPTTDRPWYKINIPFLLKKKAGRTKTKHKNKKDPQKKQQLKSCEGLNMFNGTNLTFYSDVDQDT